MRALAWLVLLMLTSCVGMDAVQPVQIDLAQTGFATLTPNEQPFFAPNFTLLGLDRNRYQLSEQQGHWVVLNFWQTTCAPCVAEMPALEALANRYTNLVVWAINIRETPEQIQQFLDEQQLTLTVLIGNDAVSLDYTVMALPQTVVVAPNGEVVYRQFGALQLDEFSKLFG